MDWNQEQAVAFECAREVITDLMAIYSLQIATEEAKGQGATNEISELKAKRTSLAAERAALSVHDTQKIARIRADYGSLVRKFREQPST